MSDGSTYTSINITPTGIKTETGSTGQEIKSKFKPNTDPVLKSPLKERSLYMKEEEINCISTRTKPQANANCGAWLKALHADGARAANGCCYHSADNGRDDLTCSTGHGESGLI
ncbi:hypothetical protein EVAR_72199_1 [Eumeta japonica]|uniref:Uncharacterized protein n=1 Tax=Eumeta variegata TaxID=151549 RepID=A0A4C1SIU1_EUMVA|nr:hypothetical protein EVAR_72199_1 [Eumeta japonica]